MGRIVSSFFTTVDGVVEGPHRWHFPYFDDAMGQVMTDLQASATAFLMGRRLYDEWSQYWPANADTDDFGPWINALPKTVVSSTLTDPSWEGTTVVRDAAGVRALKESTDGDVMMSGSATTVRWLLAEGLLDELVLLVDPVLVGDGARLFESPSPAPLALLSSDVLPTGVLHLRYGPG